MPFRLCILSLVCLSAVLVGARALARPNGTSHRVNGFKATVRSSNFSQPPGLNFAPAAPDVSGGNGADAVAVADVNGDGKPDLVLTNWCTYASCTVPGNNIGILLGNGDGTFQAAVTYASGGLYADSVVVVDLNGDGKPDLVVANCGANTNANCAGASGNVAVLLGNGDGTFKPAVTYALGGGGYGSTSVAVADLGNGKLDIVVAGGCAGGGCVGVLLGNGDGTFQPELPPNSSGGVSALSVAIGDVNGDGNPDVVVTNQCTDTTCTNSTVGVLLSNGDGTFQPVVPYGPGGLFADWIVIADVNGDGKPDLVVANSSTSTTVDLGNVAVLLGNGDGTFQTAVAYPSGAFGAASVAVADVNSDGRLDLVVANCSNTSSSCVPAGGNVGVLLGNGDGTFQKAVTFGAGGNAPFAVAVGDLNGDGKPDVVAANCVSHACGAGTGTVGVLINTSTGGLTTTTIASSQNPSVYGQVVTFTAKVTSEGFKATPTGTVTFSDGVTKIGISNLSSRVATLTSSTLALGAHSITATYSGDSTFAPSTSAKLPQAVQGAPNTTLTISPNPVTFGTSLTFTAKVNSVAGAPPDGETVTFKDATGALGSSSLLKGTAIFTSKAIAGGTYSVVASYAGDASFLPSTSMPQQVNVQDFTLTANPKTISVSAPGQGGSTTITITTVGNLKATSLTNWTCSGLPSESACAFGAVDGNGQVNLSITTKASSDLRWPLFGHRQRLFYAIFLPGLLGAVSVAGQRRTLRSLRLSALIVVLALPVLWLACGSGSSAKTPSSTGTPTGSNTVTVSATSGTLQRSTPITVTVQ